MAETKTRLAAEMAEIERQDAQRTAQVTLQPCPFCGAAPRLVDRTRSFDIIKGAFVQCLLCDMGTPVKETADEAIAAWNRRAAQQPAPIGYTWTYMGMRHFTGSREVAEQIAATATELAQPVEVRPVCVAGAAIGKGGRT